MRLINPYFLDRQTHVEKAFQPSGLNGPTKHVRRAIRKNGGRQPDSSQSSKGSDDLRVGVQREVAVGQSSSQPLVLDPVRCQRELQRGLSEVPEIDVTAHQGMDPRILELLGTPQ